MEDNNGINKQSNAVDYKTRCEQLEEENANYKQAIENLYNRAKQLENTWILNRATFLFEVLKLDAFSSDVKIKAEEELTNFLFPEPDQVDNENKSE